MTDKILATPLKEIAASQRLSQTYLWEIQRQFFIQQGTRAWNVGKMRHYATSNPFMAYAYSEVVTGFLRDCLAQGIVSSEPIYIFELGAGSGRFSYHFLSFFLQQAPPELLEQVTIRYVMTDCAEQTLDAWRTRDALQSFVEQGILDFARFDLQQDRTLTLIHSGQQLRPDMMPNPSVLLANCFFDSLLQDLFFIQAGEIYETRVSLSTTDAAPDLTQPEMLERLSILFEDRPTTVNYYEYPGFNRLLETYRQQLYEASLLFPTMGLMGLNNLRQLTSDRLLLLSADKGYTQLTQLEGQEKPSLAFHKGCFSLMVNYHAIAQYVIQQGGHAFTPEYCPRSLAVCAFLFDAQQSDCATYRKTHDAYRAAIQNKGADNFF